MGDMSKEIMEGVVELNEEEWDALIDREARSRLGISGEEFKRRWRAKDWASFGTDCPCCVPAVADIGMLVG